jgi:UDP-N-acetylmuramoyl-tripeptide--D-alanyl-D-alanine ligase
VLNADDDLTAPMSARTAAATLTFGTAGDVSWRDVALDDLGRPTFEIGYDGAWHPVRLRESGAHQVLNAAAAAAMAVAAGLPLEQIATALSAATSASPMRMELHERADGLVVINDSYNANPASMTAAIQALVAIGGRRARRTVAVLGEMRELGDDSHAAHLEVGGAAAAAGVDVLVVVGEPAAGIAEGALAVMDWSGEAIVTAGRDEALLWVRENVAAADVVLVKASNGVALWAIADAVLDHGPDAQVEGEVRAP